MAGLVYNVRKTTKATFVYSTRNDGGYSTMCVTVTYSIICDKGRSSIVSRTMYWQTTIVYSTMQCNVLYRLSPCLLLYSGLKA